MRLFELPPVPPPPGLWPPPPPPFPPPPLASFTAARLTAATVSIRETGVIRALAGEVRAGAARVTMTPSVVAAAKTRLMDIGSLRGSGAGEDDARGSTR